MGRRAQMRLFEEFLNPSALLATKHIVVKAHVQLSRPDPALLNTIVNTLHKIQKIQLSQKNHTKALNTNVYLAVRFCMELNVFTYIFDKE